MSPTEPTGELADRDRGPELFDDYPYNDELLLTGDDRDAARRRYPHIYPALYHKELGDLFLEIDDWAKRAKRRSRNLGFLAVFLVAFALLAASAEPLYGDQKQPLPQIVAFFAVAAGVAGAGIGLNGVLSAGSKRRWLEERLCTERLRQFHFQTLTAWAPDILAAAADGRWEAFLEKRNEAFKEFHRTVIRRKGYMLNSLLTDDDSLTGSTAEPWLVEAPNHRGLENHAHFAEFATMYCNLRIQRQIDFARLKLLHDHSLFPNKPKTQAERLSAATMICVSGIIVAHLIVLLELLFPPHNKPPPMLALAVVWLAIIALALRTIEEGLQPRREVERYRNYRSALQNVRLHFNAAHAAAGKFAAMRELEELSFDEMVNFLKSNHEAKFVM